MLTVLRLALHRSTDLLQGVALDYVVLLEVAEAFQGYATLLQGIRHVASINDTSNHASQERRSLDARPIRPGSRKHEQLGGEANSTMMFSSLSSLSFARGNFGRGRR